MTGGCLGGYTGYYPGTSQDPDISIFKAKGPTYGQMKGNIDCFMRFPRYGPRMGPR